MKAHARDLLSDKMWKEIRPLFPKRTRPGTGRNFLEAVMFKARTGVPWRDLPERFGRWDALFQRFNWWAKAGFFAEIAIALREKLGVDLSEASLDSTTVKMHASAHGGSKKTRPKGSPGAAGPRRSTPSSRHLAGC